MSESGRLDHQRVGAKVVAADHHGGAFISNVEKPSDRVDLVLGNHVGGVGARIASFVAVARAGATWIVAFGLHLETKLASNLER